MIGNSMPLNNTIPNQNNGSPLFILKLATCAIAIVTITASSGQAHQEITDVLLSDRSANCADYADTYSAEVTDIQSAKSLSASLAITATGDSCEISSNAVPNHDFNAAGQFVTPLAEQNQSYTVPANPSFAAEPTALSLRYDNAVFLNGVKLDLLAAGCFGVGNGRIGCRD
ncbi:MAG: hypothetical protein ABJ327_07300, partial [Litoreibacter sp.]